MPQCSSGTPERGYWFYDAWLVLRRYWPHAAGIAVVVGGFVWWAKSSLGLGLVGTVLVFAGAILAAFELHAFLPLGRRVSDRESESISD